MRINEKLVFSLIMILIGCKTNLNHSFQGTKEDCSKIVERHGFTYQVQGDSCKVQEIYSKNAITFYSENWTEELYIIVRNDFDRVSELNISGDVVYVNVVVGGDYDFEYLLSQLEQAFCESNAINRFKGYAVTFYFNPAYRKGKFMPTVAH